MKKHIVGSISILFSLFGFGIYTPLAHAAPAITSQVPNKLQVPAKQRLLLKSTAKGSQIYVCKAKADSNTFEWTLKAPEAVLYNDQGQKLGLHYAGPTWEANDGSKVMAKVIAKTNAPQASAIDWLLLGTKSRTGNGIFSQVNWIQRLETVGGKAPVKGCDRAHQNYEVRVPYTAIYYFFGTPKVTQRSY